MITYNGPSKNPTAAQRLRADLEMLFKLANVYGKYSLFTKREVSKDILEKLVRRGWMRKQLSNKPLGRRSRFNIYSFTEKGMRLLDNPL